METYKLESKWSTHTSSGELSKGIYSRDNILYFVKGNTKNNREPYSEVLSHKLSKLLNIETLEYWLEDKKYFPEIEVYGECNHVSISKYLNINLYQFYEYYSRLKGKRDTNYFKWYIDSGLSLNHLYKMLFLDAVIGNKDRHLNNFDIIYNKETNKFSNAIILDCGASLLYNISDIELKMLRENQIGPNASKPFKETHTQQLVFLNRKIPKEYRELQLPTIDEELRLKIYSEVLNVGLEAEFSIKRIEIITQYVYNRLKFFSSLGGYN